MLAARQATGEADTSMFDPLEPRLKLLVDDLPWWGEALRSARDHS